MPKTEKRARGDWGENKAALFLIDLGYEIIEKNYRVKQGELDIIAWHKKKGVKTLCFIEVKTRANNDDGGAERATGYDKLTHIFFAARHYCLAKQINTNKTAIQFEHVSVYYTPGSNDEPEIKLDVIPVD